MAITVTRENITLIVAVTAALTGVSGIVLSLFNFWLVWRRDRIALKVRPTFLLAFPAEGGLVKQESFIKTANGQKVPKVWGVEITNKGTRVRVKEVGFLSKGTRDRAVILKQWPPCYVEMPYMLEPHDSISIFGDAMSEEALEHAANYKCAFARVASGKYFTGTSSGLKLNVRKLR